MRAANGFCAARAVLQAPVLALAVMLAVPTAAASRAFTVDDLLKLESFGEAAVDPTGRWLVFDRTDPYGSGARYDADVLNDIALSRLYLVDLARPGPARRLLQPQDGPGHVAGPFSPSGARLAVYRLADGRWELGVVDLPGGAVRWLGATPEYALDATTVHWLSDREVLVLSRTDGRPPWVFRRTREGPDRLPALWAATARGEAAFSVHGSGAYRDAGPPRSPVELLRLDVVSGVRQVLASGDFVDLETAPDGRHAAVLEAGETLQPHPGRPVQGASGTQMETRQLVVIDLGTGAQARPCPACDVLDSLLSWAPDGRSLLIYARSKGAPWAEGRLARFDLGVPGLNPITPTIVPELKLRPEVVRAGWMGADPVVFGRRAGTPAARPDWFRLAPSGPINLTAGLKAPRAALSALDPAGLTLVADGAAWRIDADGTRSRLTEGDLRPWPAPRTRFNDRAALTPPASGEALGLREVRDRLQLVAASPGHQPARTALPVGARILAYSQAYRSAVALLGGDTRPQSLQVISAFGAVEVATGNAHLRDVDAPRIREVRHLGPDGQPLKSWLLLPRPRADGRPPPLVIRPYLGSSFAAPFPTMPYVNQLAVSADALVGEGYAVLLPSLPKPRGTDDFVTGLADRLLAIVDAAAADPALKGAFDPTELALWSHSYGGYTIGLIISQTDRFKAAIASSPPMDLAGMFGTFHPNWRVADELGTWAAYAAGWTEDAQAGMHAPPWEAPERYVRASPLYQAGRINTPLLLFQGDQDFVSLTQAEMMFSALYRQDKDALLVTYWGEGHALSGPGTVRDRYARAFDWLHRHLQTPASEQRLGTMSRRR